MHPEIVMSAVPLGPSLGAWDQSDYETVAAHLKRGVGQVTSAGADFYICPGNTAHIVLEQIADDLPIPGLHIADAVSAEIFLHGWRRIGLIGTRWTTNGPVYGRTLARQGLDRLTPDEATGRRLDEAIFEKLCQGVFDRPTTDVFLSAIAELRDRGAECVVLACAEIPHVIDGQNSPLPVLDSTRLQARAAILEALSARPLTARSGWLEPPAAVARPHE